MPRFGYWESVGRFPGLTGALRRPPSVAELQQIVYGGNKKPLRLDRYKSAEANLPKPRGRLDLLEDRLHRLFPEPVPFRVSLHLELAPHPVASRSVSGRRTPR